MKGRVFSIAEEHPPKANLTISASAGMSGAASVTYFSLGAGTDIAQEAYESPVLYIGCAGRGTLIVGRDAETRPFCGGDISAIRPNTLCGIASEDGLVLAEVMPQEEVQMNSAVKAGGVFRLADLVPYEKGGISNMDVAAGDGFKLSVMAFDEGTALSPHRAPGDALVFALEGEAVIGYEGEEHAIKDGENFRFEKGALHSVKADGRFKMALLLLI